MNELISYIFKSHEYEYHTLYFKIYAHLYNIITFEELTLIFNIDNFELKNEIYYNDVEKYLEQNLIKLIRLQKLQKINISYEYENL